MEPSSFLRVWGSFLFSLEDQQSLVSPEALFPKVWSRDCAHASHLGARALILKSRKLSGPHPSGRGWVAGGMMEGERPALSWEIREHVKLENAWHKGLHKPGT